MSKYSKLQIDAIREISNIGGGNAATSISKLINSPVGMDVPIVEILDYENVYENIMLDDHLVNAVIVRVSGYEEGVFIYFIDNVMANRFAELMLPDGVEASETMRNSVIKELVNIMVNSFMNSTSKLLNINLDCSVPYLTIDMFGAIFSSIYLESNQYDDEIMIIKNKYSYLDQEISSSLYFIPKPGALENLFTKLGL